uniref:Odontogenic, ameloblast associated n=1 Tax=Oryzias melastigma TaxID=30732 RepID=A0A3B3BNZ3_ORYME
KINILCVQILRLNGLTLAALGQAQASSLLPQLVLQQPDLLLTPQMVNFNPQLAGPFGPQGPQLLLPNQGGQVTSVLLPNGQQEQLGPQQDPNNPNIPQQAQNPMQMYPSYQYPSFGFPHLPRQQGFRYFVPSYGYPQQRNPAMLQPNNGQQNLDRTTQRPQLPLQTMPAGTQKESSTVPPDPRGDATVSYYFKLSSYLFFFLTRATSTSPSCLSHKRHLQNKCCH